MYIYAVLNRSCLKYVYKDEMHIHNTLNKGKVFIRVKSGKFGHQVNSDTHCKQWNSR